MSKMKYLNEIESLLDFLDKQDLTKEASSLRKATQDFYIKKISLIKKSQENNEELEESSEMAAEESGEEDSSPAMSEAVGRLIGCLRANLAYTQSAHWTTKGNLYYSDHLLFERLYDEDVDEIDLVAEQFIPEFGDDTVDPIKSLKWAAECLEQCTKFNGKMTGEELAKQVMESETTTLKQINDLYDDLKEKDKLTKGADDLLMELARNHESHIYLLGQRLK